MLSIDAPLHLLLFMTKFLIDSTKHRDCIIAKIVWSRNDMWLVTIFLCARYGWYGVCNSTLKVTYKSRISLW